MLYTGLDYHRSFSYITTMNNKDEIINQKKLPSNGQIPSRGMGTVQHPR